MSTRQKALTLVELSTTWAGAGANGLGFRVVKYDTSGNDVQMWLPDVTKNRHILLFKSSASNTLTVNASAKGPLWSSSTASHDMDDIGDTLELFSNGVTWIVLNKTVIVR